MDVLHACALYKVCVCICVYKRCTIHLNASPSGIQGIPVGKKSNIQALDDLDGGTQRVDEMRPQMRC